MGDLTPTPPPTPISTPPGPTRPRRSVLGVVRFVLARALADPVREGRLKEIPAYPWPPGLRAVVIATYVLFVVLTLAVAASAGLRTLTLLADKDLSLPWVAVPVLVLAMTVALSLLYTAALRLWWPLRVLILTVLTLALLSLPTAGGSLGLLANLAGVVLLLGFAVVRARRRFSVWEFAYALAVFGHVLVLRLATPLLLGVENSAVQVTVVAYWGTLLTVLATPAVIMAGAAMTELAVRAGAWTVRGVGGSLATPRERRIGGVLFAALVAWSVAQEAWQIVADPRHAPRTLPVAAAVLGVMALAGVLVLRLTPRGQPLDPDDVADAYGPVSWPLAFLLAGWAFVGVITTLIGSVVGAELELGRWVRWALFVGIGLAYAVHQARRNRPARALIAVVLATSSPVAQVLLTVGLGTSITMLVTVEVLAGVLVLGWLVARRRLSADRLLALATVFVLTRLYQFREVLADPLVALFALSGTSAALLVGLVWRQFTEYAGARGDSARFPNPSRLLLSLANMTMISLAIALFALGGEAGVVDLGVIESLGDSELGAALLHAAIFAGLWRALRGRAPRAARRALD